MKQMNSSMILQVFLTESPTILSSLPDAQKQEQATGLSFQASELSIATWNIENFPGVDSAETNSRLERIAATIVKGLKGPNIVAIQEIQVR
jgi:hypothetical protein